MRLGQIAKLMWMLGREEQRRLVQQYIDTNKDTGYWLDLKEDSFNEEEWVWVEPEVERFTIPYNVQIVQVEERRYRVYASRILNRDALEYCPCYTLEEIEDAIEIIAAGYKSFGEVEKIFVITDMSNTPEQ